MSLYFDYKLMTLKPDKELSYFPAYETFLKRYVNYSPIVLEIGVAGGGSIAMWQAYFGPYSKINGIDINPWCAQFDAPQFGRRVFIGDQSDTKFLQSVIDEIGTPDIIIDDGSHKQEHIRASFDFLYPKLHRNGVYIVEDLHMAYEYGVAAKDNFIDYCKELLEELHGAFLARPTTNFHAVTRAIHVYQSLVVFEKGSDTFNELLHQHQEYLRFGDDGHSLEKLPKPKEEK